MCGGGAQRPILRVNEPKKTGVRSTRPKHTSTVCHIYICIVHKNGRTLVKISTVQYTKLSVKSVDFPLRSTRIYRGKSRNRPRIFLLRLLCFCLYLLYKSAFWGKELAKLTYFMLPAEVLKLQY
jgi:hypothetical protein